MRLASSGAATMSQSFAASRQPSAAPAAAGSSSRAARAQRPAWQQAVPAAPAAQRRRVAAAGEGRSANRTKWATSELAGGAAAAVLDPPAAAEAQQQEQQQDASELVSARVAAAAQPVPARLRRALAAPPEPRTLPPGCAGVGGSRGQPAPVPRNRSHGARQPGARAAGDAAAPHRPPPLLRQHRCGRACGCARAPGQAAWLGAASRTVAAAALCAGQRTPTRRWPALPNPHARPRLPGTHLQATGMGTWGGRRWMMWWRR